MKNINWNEVQNFYDNNHFWNEILIKFDISCETLNQSIKQGLFKTRSRSESIKLKCKLFPKTHSEETKNKISTSMKLYFSKYPDKVPYLLNHSSKESYPEKYFEKILKKSNLKYDRYLQISKYNLDFAFVNKGIDLEIDGNQHYTDKRILKSNKERDNFLRKNGWKVIRIRWSFYKSMEKEKKKEYIQKLLQYLKNEINEIPSLISNKKYCECGKEIEKRSTYCKSCSKLRQPRKVENRPSINTLLKEISNSNYKSVGKKYGVSDNTIRNWIK